jgi:hypothetical protein
VDLSEKLLLQHYSYEEVGELYPVKQVSHWFKPDGFWLSVGEAWKEFLEEGKTFEVGPFLSYWELELESILCLSTIESVAAVELREDYSTRIPDWFKVAENYKGVLFSPYFYEVRHQLSWYHSVDLPSAVVWDPTCLRRVG